jgi:hypothetical protein
VRIFIATLFLYSIPRYKESETHIDREGWETH